LISKHKTQFANFKIVEQKLNSLESDAAETVNDEQVSVPQNFFLVFVTDTGAKKLTCLSQTSLEVSLILDLPRK
jgi:hypothetical protein